MNSPKPTASFILSSLIELGLILFFITFIVLACAQLMLRRLEARAGGATRHEPRALSRRRRRAMACFSSLSIAAALSGWSGWRFILGALVVGGLAGTVAHAVHRDDAAARLGRRPCQRHCWAAW